MLSKTQLIMETTNIHWVAILLAALSGFIIGGIWYSPLLFAKAWMVEAGVSEESAKNANKGKIFGFAFLFLLVAAVNLAFFLASPDINFSKGALYGLLTGFGWVAMAIGVNSLFEQKSWKYIAINAGYWIVTLTVMGAIIGAFN